MSSSYPILAALLSPALFYAGVAGMSAPILIHLLARRRFKRIRWAAMEFLISAERRNRRRLRMEEWILLALRCLAIALIGLAVARPFLDPVGLAMALRGSQRTERVFVLDDSFSMAYASADGTSFDRAKLAVRRILELVRRETPDDTVTVVRMTDVEHPVDAGTYLNDNQTQELLARLEAITPSAKSIDPGGVMRQLAEVLERAPNVNDAAIYVLSDFQRYNWAPAAGTGSQIAGSAPPNASSGVFAPLKAWAKDQRRFHVVLVDVGAADPSNVVVSDLSVPSGQLVAGSEASVRVVVGRWGGEAKDGVELQATVGDLVQPSEKIASVPPGQTATVDLRTTFLRPGFEPVRVEIPTDALPIDNVRYLAADVVSAIRILVVDGEPSPDPFDDEVTFLTTALRPEGEAFSGNDLTVVDETQLGDTDLDPFHLIILANVYRPSDPVIESLERFVRGGGGLMIIAGDQVDPGVYNASLFRQGQGLLPAQLTEVIRPATPAHLVLVDRLHPALRGLSQGGDPLGLGQIPFFVVMGCEPFAGSEQSSDEADSPDAANATAPGLSRTERPSNVLARFDDPAESAAIVERPFGLGRVLLITTSADKAWNAWPDHPTYLPVVMELSRYAARRNAGDAGRLVGAPVEMTLDPNVFSPDAIVRTPAFPNERDATLTGKPSEGRGLVLTWERTDQPGIYQFLLRRLDGTDETRLVAINVDPQESDPRAADEVELRRAAGDVPVVYVAGLEKIAATAGEGRTELWRAALIAALAALLAEQSLAWLWGRRR